MGGVGAPALCNPALSHTPATPDVDEYPTPGCDPPRTQGVCSCGTQEGMIQDPQDTSSANVHFAVWACDGRDKVTLLHGIMQNDFLVGTSTQPLRKPRTTLDLGP